MKYRILILLALFILAYWIPLKGIVNNWLTNDDYSYGFLIPFITLYLLYDTKDRLKNLILSPSWSILPLILFFIIVSIYGILGSSGHVSRPAIPVIIFLFAIFLFGVRTLRKFALPLGFLIFMVPLPNVLDRTIGVFLKSISSKLGGFFIRIADIPVHVSGNVIDLGVSQLQVVDACSGLRFVFPLLALGILYAYFFERVLWKQIVCVLLTIPIAIFTNGLRIGITGVLTNSYGSEVAEGFFHGFSGWAIFMIAFAFLFLCGRILKLFPDKSSADSRAPKGLSESKGTQGNATASQKSQKAAFAICAVLLISVGILSWSTDALPPIEIKGGIQSFPLSFSEWEGKPLSLDNEIIVKSGAESAFQGIYSHQTLGEVYLYMGYRSSAFLENENFFHSPTVCLPGSGWKITKQQKHVVENVPFFGNIEVTKLSGGLMGHESLVYFWFQTKDKTSHDKNINRFHLALHALKRDNTHDLFIRLITSPRPDEAPGAAEKRLDIFASDMMRTLLDFLDKNQFESVD